MKKNKQRDSPLGHNSMESKSSLFQVSMVGRKGGILYPE